MTGNTGKCGGFPHVTVLSWPFLLAGSCSVSALQRKIFFFPSVNLEQDKMFNMLNADTFIQCSSFSVETVRFGGSLPASLETVTDQGSMANSKNFWI